MVKLNMLLPEDEKRRQRTKTTGTARRKMIASAWSRGAVGLCLLIVVTLLDGCKQTSSGTWTQINGDASNTNSALVAPSNLQASSRSTVRFTQSGGPGRSNPVEGPNGSVYISVFDGPMGASSHTVRVRFGVRIRLGFGQVGHLPDTVDLFGSTYQGQISTPAIDSSGNVYVVVNSLSDAGPPNGVEVKSHIVKLDPDGTEVWKTDILLPRFQTPAPKIFEYNGKINVFVPVRMNESIMIGVIDGASATGQLNTVIACDYPIESHGIAATPTPASPPSPPFPEGPVPAIVSDSASGTPCLIMPTSYCAISFFQIAHDPNNVAWPPGLAFPVFVNRVYRGDNVSFGSPSISVSSGSGYALIQEDTNIFAYDYTGNAIPNWQVDNAQWGVPIANMANTMIICRSGRVYLCAADHPDFSPSTTAPSAALDGVEAVAVTPTSVFVHGRDGLFRYDAQMHLQSFAPMGPSDGGGIAIGTKGTVYVASSDQNLYRFPIP
jgi:hypothetical protein